LRGILKIWLNSSLQSVVDLDRGDFEGDFKNLVEQFSSVLDGLGPGGFSGGFLKMVGGLSSVLSGLK
jgi:hypothetical protein